MFLYMNELLVFLTIQGAMIFYACSEAYMERDTGWTQNEMWFRINFGNYNYTAYHIFVYWLAFPMAIILLPNLIIGFDMKMSLFLLVCYLIGTIVEDFTWFVVNAHYPLKKWNPHQTQWYPWLKIRWFYIPATYVIKGGIALFVFFRYYH